jgi:arylsulfatase A-like enzyme/Tfp pilus assembly protein PilF
METPRWWRSRCAIALWIAVGLQASGCSDPIPPAERVVLVTIDTLRADHVGAYGDEQAHTPTLDFLSRSGVRFEHAASPAPITLPSHTSIMTALDPPQHGVRTNGLFSLAEEIPTVAERMKQAGFATGAFVAAFVLESRFGLDRGFDVYDDEIGLRRASAGAFAVPERRGDEVVDSALRWLEDAPDRFFLWVHLYDPHADYRPPPRFERLAEGDAYRGEIAFADFQVGRLLEGIRRRFGLEGLLFVVTSDHGESLGEHGEQTHTYGIYDATQWVPLLMMGPGLPAGRAVATPVRLVDVGPTLLARAGAAPLGEVRGRDLAPLVFEPRPEPRVAYMETLDTQLAMDWSPLLGVRTDRFKYIRAPAPELYDLAADPHELDDLAAERPEIVAELDATLDTLLAGARPISGFEEMSAEDRARLAALGYVVSDSESRLERLGVVGGPDPKDFMEEGVLLNRAGSRIGRGRYREALALLERVRSDGNRVTRHRGMAAALGGEPELALKQAGILLERDPADVFGLWIRAMARLQQGDRDAARADLEAALEIDPNNISSRLSLGRILELEGDLAGAEAEYRRAAEVSEYVSSPLVHLAELHLRQGEFEKADALFEQVGAALASEVVASLRVAETEWQAGRRERAIAVLEAAGRHTRDDGRIPLQMASYLELSGRADEALVLRRKVLSREPGNAKAQNDLAWSLARAGVELDRALELATEAARRLDDQPAVLDTLATVRLARGEAREALEVADRALAEAPEAVRAHLLFVRASALSELGRSADARRALRESEAATGDEPPEWHAEAEALAKRLGVTL